MAGVIYIITSRNYALKGLYKIGYTCQPIAKRLSSLNTSNPTDHSLVALKLIPCKEARKVEGMIHEELKKCTILGNSIKSREFFKAPYPLLLKVVLTIVKNYIVIKNTVNKLLESITDANKNIPVKNSYWIEGINMRVFDNRDGKQSAKHIDDAYVTWSELDAATTNAKTASFQSSEAKSILLRSSETRTTSSETKSTATKLDTKHGSSAKTAIIINDSDDSDDSDDDIVYDAKGGDDDVDNITQMLNNITIDDPKAPIPTPVRLSFATNSIHAFLLDCVTRCGNSSTHLYECHLTNTKKCTLMGKKFIIDIYLSYTTYCVTNGLSRDKLVCYDTLRNEFNLLNLAGPKDHCIDFSYARIHKLVAE